MQHISKSCAPILRRKNINEFTADELANMLGITVRSAHRIILKWMDAGIISVIGTEKLLSRGRPRQVFRLDFINIAIIIGLFDI